MNTISRYGWFVSGAALGAGLMYLLDPVNGSQRRAQFRDQSVRAGHQVQDLLGKAGDLSHRMGDAVAEFRERVSAGNGGSAVSASGELAERSRNWTPALQLAAGSAGAAAMIYGVYRALESRRSSGSVVSTDQPLWPETVGRPVL